MDDAEYNENMKTKAGTNPETFIPELNEQLLSAQSASGVEVVTGATHSSESFQNYAQQLIKRLKRVTLKRSKSIMVQNLKTAHTS